MNKSNASSPDLPAILARADRLAEARAKATAGPWNVWHCSPGDRTFIDGAGRYLAEMRYGRCGEARSDKIDAAFIALARNLAVEDDVRAMAGEIERLKAEVARLGEVIMSGADLIARLRDDDGLTERGIKLIDYVEFAAQDPPRGPMP